MLFESIFEFIKFILIIVIIYHMIHLVTLSKKLDSTLTDVNLKLNNLISLRKDIKKN